MLSTRQTAVKAPHLPRLQNLLATHQDALLQVKGCFQGKWIHGWMSKAFDSGDLADTPAGELYVELTYANNVREDISWGEMRLKWTDDRQTILSKHPTLEIAQAHEQLLQVLRDSEALQELSNHAQPSGVKRSRGGGETLPPSQRVRTQGPQSQPSISRQPSQYNPQQRDRSGEFAQAWQHLCRAFNVSPETASEWAGHIAEVKVQNFMCHDNFEFKLGPNVTFISGQNGSGKSAVLQATQACLGVTARETGRGSTIKGFVKTGCHSAVVSVTVWNPPGDGAFRYDTFGPSITVKRVIRANGGTETKILDCLGQVPVRDPAPKPNQELRDMLDYFNINAGVPVVVMTQDTARTFATAKDNRQLFKLYNQCLEFDKTQNALVDALGSIQGARDDVVKAKEQLKHLSARHQEVSQRLEQCTEIDNWRQQVSYLKHMMFLREVRQKRQDIETADITKEDKYDELQQGKARKATLETLAEEQQAQAHICAVQVSNVKPELEKLKAQQEKSGRDKIHAEKRLYTLQRQETQLNAAITTATRALNQLQQSVEEDRAAEIQATQAILNDFESQQKALSQEKEAANVALTDAQNQLSECTALLRKAQNELYEKEDAVDKEKQELKKWDADIGNLKRRQRGNNSVQEFGGPPMEHLLRLTHRDHAKEFTRPPIGPLGYHLELQDDAWGTAVQAAIGNMLNNMFVVHDWRDQHLLRRLAQQAGVQRLKIITYNFDRPLHTIPEDKQLHGLTTLLSQLHIKNTKYSNALQNALMDHHLLERCVLVEDELEGLQLLRTYHRAHVIAWVQCKDGGRCTLRGTNTSFIPSNGRRHAVQLVKNIDRALEHAQCQRNEVHDKVKELQWQRDALKASAEQLQGEEHSAKEHVRVRREAFMTSQSQLQQLRETGVATTTTILSPEADPSSQDDPQQLEITRLQQELRDCTNTLQTVRADLQQWQQLVNQHTAEYDTTCNRIRETLGRVNEVDEELQNAQAAYGATMEEIERLCSSLPPLEEWLNAYETMRGEAVKQLEEVEAEGRHVGWEYSEEAWEACLSPILSAFPQLQQCVDDLEQLEEDAAPVLRGLEERVETSQRRAGMSVRQMKAELQKLEEQISTMKQETAAASATLKHLRRGYTTRWTTFEQTRREMAQDVSHKFSIIMGRRGWAGEIEVDYTKEELHIRVTTSDGRMVPDLKSLSGGERSYTTLSFVLALGQANASPFHVFDEYDVFMDQNVRVIATRELLRHAHQLRSTQFILLSPQDPSAVLTAQEEAARKEHTTFEESFLTCITILKNGRAA